MAIPAKAKAFTDSADPYDRVEWIAECAGAILEDGEEISTFTCVLDSAAVALGVSIVIDGTRDPALVTGEGPAIPDNTAIRYWLEVDPLERENVAFDTGVKAAVTISITTNSTPSRRRQRTWVATLEQQ